VSLTTSANYLSVMGSILIFNFYSSLILVNYQQVYSLFYYLNSSAVMQTDWVIENYGKMNIN
jgi:glucan-binding YG repeat protein